ncbi:MAG TPA: 2-phospho-L-lactate guanylyltransferase [Candidatus Binataceae bacterium]|nr:2-phospho-L-lactate guanylyltransferase [Candidatus Binataceae bacterium]
MRVVLIAAKELAFAKSRLASRLDAEERKLLAEAMFRDVLAAAMSARLPDHIAVVSSDRALLELAQTAGALVIDEEFPRGLNTAVRLATGALIAEGARALVTLLSDIPLVTGEDIDTVMRSIPRAPGVVLVPSRDRTGTNMIARTPGDVLATRFGSNSLARHLGECRRLNLACELVNLPRPAVDLDLVSDLIEFMREPSTTHTFRQLARLGLFEG